MKTFVVGSWLLVFLGPSVVEADEVPNVVLFMADDMGIGDTSAYQDVSGNSDAVQLHTPNMDRLARMGVRFTDAHTPASRCTTTRYGLLTGRYCFRTRLKYFVLFGNQGDPLIERDRPTLGTLFQKQGYRTALFGKWHVGLRYRRSDGSPAEGWADADLTQPLFDCPLDHGFDVAMYTSRSHATSGPMVGHKNPSKRNGPNQEVGPGHLVGRKAVGATGNGKELVAYGEFAYVLEKLGSYHHDNAMAWLQEKGDDRSKPFFLYYPANSNHGPYTPDSVIAGVKVAGASRNKLGEGMSIRYDYINENDIVLGQILDYLENTEDPRNQGSKLIANTIVIFTSDNGAEKKSKTATGPFRSNKGSCYEGGHRVPFIVSWPKGGVGNGDALTEGLSNDSLIGLQDLYATFSEILGEELPDAKEEKGAEDSVSIASAWRGGGIENRPPMFYQDSFNHKTDNAILALRYDDPMLSNGRTVKGKWKLFLDAALTRFGDGEGMELYELSSDPKEEKNRIEEEGLRDLVAHLSELAKDHRNLGGHRSAMWIEENSQSTESFRITFGKKGEEIEEETLRVFDHATKESGKVVLQLRALNSQGEEASLTTNPRGIGVLGGKFKQVESGEKIVIHFDRDVIVESIAVVAGEGVCGGFYRKVGETPLPIYCIDADNDSRDQESAISDIGFLKAGKTITLDSSPLLDCEPAGRWRLASISARVLEGK